jgi:hypothetical protein
MSDEQVAEAQRLRTTGLSFAKIAAALGGGLSTGNVRYAICPEARAKLALLTTRWRKERMSPERRQLEVERSREYSRKHAAADKAARNLPLTEEQIARATDLRLNLGHTYKQIAATIGDGVTSHRVRISLKAALPADAQLPPRQRPPRSNVDRTEARLAKQQAKEEAEREQREAEYVERELARESAEHDAVSPESTEAEELRLLGAKLVAINRAAAKANDPSERRPTARCG